MTISYLNGKILKLTEARRQNHEVQLRSRIDLGGPALTTYCDERGGTFHLMPLYSDGSVPSLSLPPFGKEIFVVVTEAFRVIADSRKDAVSTVDNALMLHLALPLGFFVALDKTALQEGNRFVPPDHIEEIEKALVYSGVADYYRALLDTLESLLPLLDRMLDDASEFAMASREHEFDLMKEIKLLICEMQQNIWLFCASQMGMQSIFDRLSQCLATEPAFNTIFFRKRWFGFLYLPSLRSATQC